MSTPLIFHTPCGVRFGVVGEYSAPAPTLFVFAKSLEESMGENDYFEIGNIVVPQGWRCVSVDLPCHGKDARHDEPEGLDGWRARLENGEEIVAPFIQKLSAVLDCLIAKGWTDANHVAACGTSRGGFIALHFAANDARIKSAIALSPVVDLNGVPGFADMKEPEVLASLALIKAASQLAQIAIWMTIGHDDRIVNTDKVIALSRAIVSKNSHANVELHVVPTPGHTTPRGAHQAAAAWLLARAAVNIRCR